MATINWEFILGTIKDGKCILLLGPEVCLSEDGKLYEEALLDHLNVKEGDETISYYDRDGMFFFEDPIAKTMSYYKIKEFYNKGFKDTIYLKLTEIPFQVIISTTPDHNLHEVFKKKNITAKFEFYDKTEAPKDIEVPNMDSPLIYNLFGSKEKEESMILTHDDLFDFLLSILGKNKLPEELRNILHTAHNFIFLGFKFHRWYVQLLLRLLNLHNENFKFARYASNDEMNPETQTLIKDQFSIAFVEDHIETFVNELYQKCEENGILRDIQATDVEEDNAVSDLVVKSIEDGKPEEALALMKDFLKQKDDSSLLDILTSITGQYNILERENLAGNLSPNDYKIEYNKVINKIQGLNKEVKQLE